jgi:hypothetical protein
MEYFGVEMTTFEHIVLISFRSYDGNHRYFSFFIKLW